MAEDGDRRRHRAPAATTQRVENGAVALAVVVAVLVSGQPWWLLLAAFLLFDLSALGYLRGPRVGALAYNAVHNHTGPALVLTVFLVTRWAGHEATWLALLAACWAFHVAVDRALGYGLKLHDFGSTHLGPIGRARRADAPAP
ncbi:DUF4260 family protein [Desertihabitans aurantiacus]|uniref:DUF4260 family protein n=1 Tax=Desertihabitans aurantiacus TaxID=2282477 RepID=UPI000DF7E9D8|nr:DUF4260 family protein [Desertihabitans aurantiacus]